MESKIGGQDLQPECKLFEALRGKKRQVRSQGVHDL